MLLLSYAVVRCPSVRLSRSIILSKWINIFTNVLMSGSPTISSFSVPNVMAIFPPTGITGQNIFDRKALNNVRCPITIAISFLGWGDVWLIQSLIVQCELLGILLVCRRAVQHYYRVEEAVMTFCRYAVGCRNGWMEKTNFNVQRHRRLWRGNSAASEIDVMWTSPRWVYFINITLIMSHVLGELYSHFVNKRWYFHR